MATVESGRPQKVVWVPPTEVQTSVSMASGSNSPCPTPGGSSATSNGAGGHWTAGSVEEVAGAVVVLSEAVEDVDTGTVVVTAAGEEQATASRAIRVRRFAIHRR
jgi:hypothetical protein